MSHEPKSAAHGYIYALVNPSLPGEVKVGASTKDPFHRVKQLSASTSIPTPFVLAYSKEVAYPFQAEATIHRNLAKYRTNESREFFRAPLHVVIAEFDRFDEFVEERVEVSGDSAGEYPWAELFALFKDDGSPRELNPTERYLCVELAFTLNSGGKVH